MITIIHENDATTCDGEGIDGAGVEDGRCVHGANAYETYA